MEGFEQFMVCFLSRISGVGTNQSSVALKAVKYKTALPLPVGPDLAQRLRKLKIFREQFAAIAFWLIPQTCASEPLKF